jgi:hypothetical protein
LSLIASAWSVALAQPPDEAQIRTIATSWESGWNAHDMKALFALITPDADFVNVGGSDAPAADPGIPRAVIPHAAHSGADAEQATISLAPSTLLIRSFFGRLGLSRRSKHRVGPSLSNRQIDDRSGSRQGHICIPHPLIITKSNKRETTEISAKKTTDLV